MLHFLYEKLLERRILKAKERIPSHILLVLNEIDILDRAPCGENELTRGAEKLRKFVKWCMSLHINELSVYVSVMRDERVRDVIEKACMHVIDQVHRALSVYNDASIAIFADSPPSFLKVRAKDKTAKNKKSAKNAKNAKSAKNVRDEESMKITVSVGLGGRSELKKAFRTIAEYVRAGIIEPSDIDEKMIEDALIFKSEPELIIRSGCTHLTDFLIWQSVYSELYFTDVNWHRFRRTDLLRAIRDFQTRERRFGR